MRITFRRSILVFLAFICWGLAFWAAAGQREGPCLDYLILSLLCMVLDGQVRDKCPVLTVIKEEDGIDG